MLHPLGNNIDAALGFAHIMSSLYSEFTETENNSIFKEESEGRKYLH